LGQTELKKGHHAKMSLDNVFRLCPERTVRHKFDVEISVENLAMISSSLGINSIQFVPTSLPEILQVIDQGLQQDRGVSILQPLQVVGQGFLFQDDIVILSHGKIKGEPPPVGVLCGLVGFLSIPKIISQNNKNLYKNI